METQLKRKVTVKFDHKNGNAFSRVHPPSRPASPSKLPQPTSLSPPPGFRPKAKVNSSATIRNVASASSLKPNNGSAYNISRPNSPLKQVRASPSEPVPPVKARITARPSSKSAAAHVQSPSTNSESRQRSLTTVSSNLHVKVAEDRPRSGSVALHHALSTSALRTPSPPVSQASPLSERSFAGSEHSGASHVGPIKVKAKVSGLAKSSYTDNASSLSLSPPWATTRPIHTRARAPSVSSSFSVNPSPAATNSESPFYPITTAAPAANPHRYVPPRRAPSPSYRHYQPFAGSDALSASYTRHAVVPKVDPAKIPLPPQSPPISALSLSSRSSISRSSLSFSADNAADSKVSVSTVGSHPIMDRTDIRDTGYRPEGENQASNIIPPSRDNIHVDNKPPSYERESDDGDSDGSGHKARAKAKSNRKIADLEITNRSLLAINASLETTKHRQAKEIRDLRRKLRESRLILPPRAFKAVTSQDKILDEDENDHDEDDDSENGEEWATDETYRRVNAMVDGLIAAGRRALEKTPDDFKESGSARVLNAEELRSWRDSGHGTTTFHSVPLRVVGADEESASRRSLSPAHVAVPESDDEFSSEDEVAGLTMEPDTPPHAHLPPITITPSP
ncbi:hypothetical protein BV22DRAFT_1115753 [Leucogyrophana mollusca]|uniref:Uncharacterized protein n=1 Tax=Leucogyrophana mollusca TaxID=85980 RepID=A0ACB8BZL9_9AGAM|nr:hypothetical protein BV22DRAFT_1115753 [Leucogyrophana mollusca]